jgi:pimeloyl-ACP methyl ester carboxylesterase
VLHGFPENWRSWQHQMVPLAEAGFSVWAPDLRGYNQSDRPQGRDAYRLPHLTADVAALVRATGAGCANIVGHDWGGVVAWACAAEYPALVDRLVILNAPHPALYRRRLRDPRQAVRSWYVLLFLVPGFAEQLLQAWDYLGVRQMFARGAARRNAFTPEDVQAYVSAMSQPGALTAALNYYRANARSVRTVPARTAVDAETLVIWGERDPALSTILLDDITTVAPRARVHRFTDVGHWVQNEAPGTVNELLIEFLTTR